MTTSAYPGIRAHEPKGPTTGLWDPGSGRFVAVSLRLALVRRDWTPEALAEAAGCSRSSVYKALKGDGVRDRTAMAILRALAHREPWPLPTA